MDWPTILAIYLIIIPFVFFLVFSGLIYGAMYQKIPARKLDKIIALGKLGPEKRVYDLGAGFGTIAFEAAYHDAKVTAIEIDPVKVFFMKYYLKLNNRMSLMPTLYNKTKHMNVDVVKRNLLDVDYSEADVIYCYLFGPIMQKVGEKAEREMHEGAMLISVEHPIVKWKPEFIDEKDKIYVYRAPNAFGVVV